jgi:3-phosphoshikimate 1-carboxyvinyltransferase
MFPVRTSPDGAMTLIEIDGGQDLVPLEITIPGDPSSAAFLVAAAALCSNSEVTLPRVSINPTRITYLEILEASGVTYSLRNSSTEQNEPYADITIRGSDIRNGMKVTGESVPALIDEIPLLAVTAACAGLSFEIRDAGELRNKESDRISLMVGNLRAVGCHVEEYDDGFAIHPNNGLIGASIETGGDHRIAMAFGVARLVIPDLVIDDIDCASVSFKGYWEVLENLRNNSMKTM